MRCEEVRARVTAYVDDELDPVEGAEVAAHLEACPECARLEAAERSVRSAVAEMGTYHRAPHALRARVLGALREAPAEPATARPRRRGGSLFDLRFLVTAASAAAVVLVAVSVLPSFWRGPVPGPAEEALAGEVLNSHIRSLMASHLMDVASTDRHTVKPWFDGKLDFSPPVEDLAASGFPLIGGRLDYLGGRPVAALVYQRRQHVINVFVWPSARASASDAAPSTRQGYHLFHGVRRGMVYWVVSDLAPDELATFVRLIEK